MHSRKQHDSEGVPFSNELVEEISEILNFVYRDKCELQNKQIEVFGRTYETEILMAVSLTDKDDESSIPATYIVSADLESSKKDIVLDAIVDSAGMFLEQILSDPNWNDYNANWSEETVKGININYQITRENIKLSLLADQLLNQ